MVDLYRRFPLLNTPDGDGYGSCDGGNALCVFLSPMDGSGTGGILFQPDDNAAAADDPVAGKQHACGCES